MDAFAVGELHDRFGDVVGLGVDDLVGAPLAAEIELLLGDIDGEDAAAEEADHLHAVDPDAATRADDEHVVEGFDLGTLLDGVPRRADRVGGDGGGFVVEAVGEGEEVFGGECDVVGPAAVDVDPDVAFPAGAEGFTAAAAPFADAAVEVEVDADTVANREGGDAVAESDDVAGEFVAHDAGHGAAEDAAAHVGEGEADTGGANL